MFSKVEKLIAAAKTGMRQTLQAKNRVDLEMLECLSPIDRYIVSTGVHSDRALFDPSYEEWRLHRIAKILEIYGIDYFRGKRVVEVGAGHGDIGAFLRNWARRCCASRAARRTSRSVG